MVATSGDTGGAAVDAFAGRDNVDLVVLFPDGKISDVQRRMMTTSAARNVHALALEGNFDDCQAIVKGLFNHHKFRDQVSLSGVNSINWARIIAQVVYYFTSAVALGAPHREVDFTVPTGNFGDIFAGYVAKKMGLPVRRLRIAANVNDILARTLKTGIHEVREVHATASPSMDIQVSSNFERLLFEASGRDAALVRGADGLARPVRPLRAARRGAGGDPRANSTPAAPTNRRPPRRSAPPGARPAIWSIRTPRWRWRWPIAIWPMPRCPTSCSRPRMRPSFPTRSKPPAGCARNFRSGSTD